MVSVLNATKQASESCYMSCATISDHFRRISHPASLGSWFRNDRHWNLLQFIFSLTPVPWWSHQNTARSPFSIFFEKGPVRTQGTAKNLRWQSRLRTTKCHLKVESYWCAFRSPTGLVERHPTFEDHLSAGLGDKGLQVKLHVWETWQIIDLNNSKV